MFFSRKETFVVNTRWHYLLGLTTFSRCQNSSYFPKKISSDRFSASIYSSSIAIAMVIDKHGQSLSTEYVEVITPTLTASLTPLRAQNSLTIGFMFKFKGYTLIKELIIRPLYTTSLILPTTS